MFGFVAAAGRMRACPELVEGSPVPSLAAWTGEDARLSASGGAVSFGVGNCGHGKAQSASLETSQQRPVTGDL